MKCPHCGEEIPGGNECKKCGKRILASKEMEVQYKEFKVSELLDIRMPSSGLHIEGTGNPEPAPVNEDGPNSQAKKEPAAKKTHIFTYSVIAILAAIAAFFLLKYLFDIKILALPQFPLKLLSLVP